MDIAANNIDTLYKLIIRDILEDGEEVTARGLTFKERRFQSYKLINPRARLIQNPERKLSKRFAMAEFIWIMAGKCSLDQISFYNKRMKDFSDNGVDLNGAYGPRLRHWQSPGGDFDQIKSVIERLKKDIYTRQAVMVILDPKKDFSQPTKDVPCNNYLQFLFRENQLHLMCYVRSNDLLLGFPYDVFEWTMMQEVIANELKVELGSYYHIVGSAHIYHDDMPRMRQILEVANDVKHVPMTPMPSDTTIKIFEDLNKYEVSFREGKTDFCANELILPDWWKEKAGWLL